MMHVEDENNNRSVATVLSPRRKTWIIKLIRDHSETFFKGGWPEFSKFHKLEVGFKLVFRYEGNMVFNVKVFGLNGCLKDYNQDAVAILRRTGFNASREKSPAKCASVTEGKQQYYICFYILLLLLFSFCSAISLIIIILSPLLSPLFLLLF